MLEETGAQVRTVTVGDLHVPAEGSHRNILPQFERIFHALNSSVEESRRMSFHKSDNTFQGPLRGAFELVKGHLLEYSGMGVEIIPWKVLSNGCRICRRNVTDACYDRGFF